MDIIFSAATCGLSGKLVCVEVDISNGLPAIIVVGLPDTAVSESRERVRSAIKNSGFEFPDQRVTINLAPAHLRKIGPLYDLPMALGILLTSDQVHQRAAHILREALCIGELGLDGAVRSIHGVLPSVIMAKERQFKTVFVPKENASEASLIHDIEVFGISNLEELVCHLEGTKTLTPYIRKQEVVASQTNSISNFFYIKGQRASKRALEIAAAGGHNVLFSGPPGSGKTLLARTFPTIFPTMSYEESLEVTQIYSVAGLLTHDKPLVTERPFRCPHHSISSVALVGGGAWPRPGEISLAHRGVLFMDEFPEFSRTTLEQLRQPLEDRKITISRASGSLEFPASITLVASQNPCPCGFYSDPKQRCSCSFFAIEKYHQRISGPIIDRIDLFIEVPRLSFEELDAKVSSEESSQEIQKRVEAARNTQHQRFSDYGFLLNAEMPTQVLQELCILDSASRALLETAVDTLNLSPRTYYRIQKVARTIADLEGSENIQEQHLAEALRYRQNFRKN